LLILIFKTFARAGFCIEQAGSHNVLVHAALINTNCWFLEGSYIKRFDYTSKIVFGQALLLNSNDHAWMILPQNIIIIIITAANFLKPTILNTKIQENSNIMKS
jgi:hypothetical protein